MMGEEETYTMREMETLFCGIREKLEEIHVQVKATNGRVLSLEKWRSYMLGGMTAIGLMASWGLFAFMFKVLGH